MLDSGYLNILHDEIFLAREVKDLLQLDDVGMVDCGQDGDFTLDHVLFPLTFRLHQGEWNTFVKMEKQKKCFQWIPALSLSII